MDFELINKFITLNKYDASRPTLEKVLGGNIVLVILSVLILLATIVGFYAIGMKIYGKKKAYKAIIPVYGLMQLFRSISLNPWLAIACYVPLIGIIPFAIFCYYLPKAFDQKTEYQILAIFFPYVVFNMLGFDEKYEFQYVKGKNVAFKDEFRTVMPEDLTGDALTPANAVNGAAVTSMIAKESMISRAASAAAEQTRLIREEQEKAAAEEARKKQEEEEKKKAAKQKTEDFNYDIFDNDDDLGPESASLNIEFKTVNGKFQSAPTPAPKPAAPAPKPVAPAPKPVTPTAPVAPAPKPVVSAPAPAPKPQPVVPKPVAPAPKPATPAPASPGIQITTVPPKQA
jgi:hypothetical protein